MTIFTQHPHDQGITYLEHWGFAMGIAWRLFRSVVAFAVHATMPWITRRSLVSWPVGVSSVTTARSAPNASPTRRW